MIGEPSLDPPNGPDGGDPCAECGKEMDDEFFEIEGTFKCAGVPPVYVCSTECRAQYLNGWADSVMDNEWEWDR